MADRRLTHDFKAFYRAIQMSGYEAYLFVEGKNSDPFYYDKLARDMAANYQIKMIVLKADEIRDPHDATTSRPAAGGKLKLIAFHNYLRRRRKLSNIFKGKKTVSTFFADKDVDDHLRTMVRSDHFFYTRLYSVENHIFASADLGAAIAAVCSLPLDRIPARLRNSGRWCAAAAHGWRAWVTCCLLSKKVKSPILNYHATSPLNQDMLASTDPHELERFLSMLGDTLGMDRAAIKRKFDELAPKVDDLYASGRHDELFNGKWYVPILEADLRRELGREVPSRNLKEIFFATFRSQLGEFPCGETRNRLDHLLKSEFRAGAAEAS